MVPQEGAIFRARFEGLESYTFVALVRRLAELSLLVFLLRVPFVLSQPFWECWAKVGVLWRGAAFQSVDATGCFRFDLRVLEGEA